MLQLLILVVSIFLVLGNVDCFCDKSVQLGLRCGKSLSTAGILSPLRPVGGEKAIPRLEPGLRFVQARANFLANINKDIKVTKFDLSALKAFNADGTSLNNPITNLINSASNMACQWSGSLSKYAQKGINAALMLSTLCVLPKRTLTRGPSITSRAAFVTATVLAASQFASAKFLSSKPPITVASPPRTSQYSILNRLNTSLQQVKSMLDFDMNLMKWKNYDSLSATERLATTPVYFVANARGNSYMQNDAKAGNPDQKIVTYFLGYDDAARVLSEMTQMNSQAGAGIPEFLLKAVPLERAINKIRSHKQSRKLGRYEVDTIYRLQPSGHQYNNAKRLTKLQALKLDADQYVDLKGVNIPLFKAQGFTMTRSNGEVITPYYFAYEDLLEDWESAKRKLHASDSRDLSDTIPQSKTVAGTVLSLAASGVKNVFSTNGQPRVQVHELADVLCRIQGITPASAANPFSMINNPLPVPTTLWGKLRHKAQDLALDSGRKAFSLVGKAGGVVVGSLQRAASADKSSSTSEDGVDDTDNSEKSDEHGDDSDVEDSTREESTSPRSLFGSFLQPGKSNSIGADTVTGMVTDGADKTGSPSRISHLLGKLNPFGGDGVQVKKEVIGIMPPRKEIELLRKFYRNQIGFRNEFARAKFLDNFPRTDP
eukprot:gene17524-19965_t